jgi:hypothetical protein
MPGLTAQHAAMLAAQTGGMSGGLGATTAAMGGAGAPGVGLLGGALANPAKTKLAMNMMQQGMGQMAQPQRPQMMPPPPPPMVAQQRPGSMASLGVGQSMYQPRRTSYYG